MALVGLAAGGGIYTFMKQKQKKQAEKEALDPDANYTEDKGDFEIPVEDEPEETGEEDNAERYDSKAAFAALHIAIRNRMEGFLSQN